MTGGVFEYRTFEGDIRTTNCLFCLPKTKLHAYLSDDGLIFYKYEKYILRWL